MIEVVDEPPAPVRPVKAVVAGTSGTGKTTLLRRIIEPLRPKIAVWDPFGQYPVDVSYRPRRFDSRAEAEALSATAWRAAPFVLTWEEAEQIWSQNKGELPPVTKQYVLMGRNVDLGWIANVRRPQALVKSILDEADDIYLFKLKGRAFDYMVDFLGKSEGAKIAPMRTWRKEDHLFFHIQEGEVSEPMRLRLKPEDESTTPAKNGTNGGRRVSRKRATSRG